MRNEGRAAAWVPAARRGVYRDEELQRAHADQSHCGAYVRTSTREGVLYYTSQMGKQNVTYSNGFNIQTMLISSAIMMPTGEDVTVHKVKTKLTGWAYSGSLRDLYRLIWRRKRTNCRR